MGVEFQSEGGFFLLFQQCLLIAFPDITFTMTRIFVIDHCCARNNQSVKNRGFLGTQLVEGNWFFTDARNF